MKTSDLQATIERYRDALTVGRVFGEPYENNGVTVIPAANVMGGGGGGEGEAPEGSDASSGSGSGFGLVARPAGAFVIRGEEVRWQPAVDVTRILSLLLGFLTVRLVLRRGRRR